MANRNIVINEFLTFVQNKIQVLDELSIVQICASNFSEIEIEHGKSEIFKCLPEGNRLVTRKGEDKSKKNIKDVIKMFKETEPDTQPIFVAQDLNKLPPVSFDHVDVTRLLKDIAIMKNELHNMRIDTVSKSEMTMFETKVCSDIDKLSSLLNSNQKRNTICDQNTPLHGGRKNLQSGKNRIIPNVEVVQSTMQKQVSPRPAPPPPAAPPADVLPQSRLPCDRPAPRPTAFTDSPGRQLAYRDILLTPLTQSRNQTCSNDNTDKNLSGAAKRTLSSNVTIDSEGFIKVQRKKNKKQKNLCGSRQVPCKLEAAIPTAAIYLSRTKTHMLENEVKEHIRDMGEEFINVELLKQYRKTNFNSFKITISANKVKRFLEMDFWPEDLKFRRFREHSAHRVAAKTTKPNDG